MQDCFVFQHNISYNILFWKFSFSSHISPRQTNGNNISEKGIKAEPSPALRSWRKYQYDSFRHFHHQYIFPFAHHWSVSWLSVSLKLTISQSSSDTKFVFQDVIHELAKKLGYRSRDIGETWLTDKGTNGLKNGGVSAFWGTVVETSQ